MRRTSLVVVLLIVVIAPLPVLAGPLTVTSYSMLNGATGSFNYRDFTYVPCNGCNVTGAALSGGTGKLTDGVSPLTSWNQQGQLTQWVGWNAAAGLANPTVTFYFSGTVHIDSVTVWVDNTLGQGGVYLPSSVSINGNSFAIAPDNVNPSPRAYTFSGLNITGNSVNTRFFQTTGWAWIMVGEVSFSDDTQHGVPEPSTLLLLGISLGVIGVTARSRRK
jgi:hypothetical protein